MISGILQTKTQDETVWLVVIHNQNIRWNCMISGILQTKTQDEIVRLVVFRRLKHNMKLYD